MGLSYRKSIKLFGKTRLNFSKTGGIGISTGVKGARVSVNQQGIRTTIGKDGLQYRKSHSFKTNSKREKLESLSKLSRLQLGKVIVSATLKKSAEITSIAWRKATVDNNRMVQNHTEEEIKAFKNEHYTTHMKLIFGGLGCIVIGFILPPVFLIGFILEICGIVCMLKNWKRINMEYKTRISK